LVKNAESDIKSNYVRESY